MLLIASFAVARERLTSESVAPALPADGPERKALYFRLARENEAVLFRVARRCTGQAETAEDLVRQAVLNGFPAFMDGRVQRLEGFRTWILKVLWNTFLSGRRKLRREQALPENLEQNLASTGKGAEEMVEEQFADETLQALAKLSPEQRVLVEMVFIDEMEYAEAAEVLGLPIGTVRSRLARARTKLIRALEGLA